MVLLAKAGTPLMFDYRVRHRGLANRSQTPRPLLYVTFAKANYQDKVQLRCFEMLSFAAPTFSAPAPPDSNKFTSTGSALWWRPVQLFLRSLARRSTTGRCIAPMRALTWCVLLILSQANFSLQRYRKLPKQVMEGASIAHRAQR